MANEIVDVLGLGQLPSKMTFTYSGVDLITNARANHHNEGMISFECKDETELLSKKDSFTLDAEKTREGYLLSLSFDSEVKNRLLSEGTMAFVYSEKTQTWSLFGIAFDRVWKFCDPVAAFDHVTASLHCYLNSKEVASDKAEAIRILLRSIEGARDAILASAILYNQEADCQKEVEPVGAMDISLGP